MSTEPNPAPGHSQKLKVFLCHASEDLLVVREMYERLRDAGFEPWLESEHILPGMDRELEIRQAMEASHAVMICLSLISVKQEGMIQREIKYARRLQEEKPDGTIFLIPVQLEDCPVPLGFQTLQWAKYYEPGGFAQITRSLFLRADQLGRAVGTQTEREIFGLPSGSYVPFARNALFTGREEDLRSLADSFLDHNAALISQSQAVTGMGGLGKTQLAVEFAYRYGHRFKGVHWLDLRDPETVEAAIALCGTRMGYAQVDQRELVASTTKTWIEDGPRLLILDNFEDVAHVNEVLARFQHPSLRLLVTSRRRDFPKASGLRVQKLGLFSTEEGADFLKKTLEHEETFDARKRLADQLGGLPLALELAASYINITNIGIADYLRELANISRLETEQAEWFQSLEVTNPTDHEQSLFGTFRLSWQEVQDETSRKVFMIAGYLAPNTPIPLEIFKKTLELEGKEVSKALYRLNALGLLPLTDNLPSIHPLLAVYARTLSSRELLESLAGKLKVLADEADEEMYQSGRLGVFVPLRPHILSAADFAEEAGIQYASDLLGTLGNYLTTIADYQGAKVTFERVARLDETALGPDHPKVASAVNNLGLALKNLGDMGGARAAYERALKINEAALGPDHPDVATTLNNLGLVLKALGNLAGARSALERAVKIDEAAFGPDHPNVAIRVNNLGRVLKDLGDLAEAKAAFERALMIAKTALGPNHPIVARSVNNLGLALKDLGDLAGAKAAFEQALTIDEAVYGPDHPTVATDVTSLGSVLKDLGDLAGAKDDFERALRMYRKFLPEGHPSIQTVQANLDAVLKELGK